MTIPYPELYWSVMENNEIIGYVVLTPNGDLFKFDTLEEAIAVGTPIPVIHVEEIQKFA